MEDHDDFFGVQKLFEEQKFSNRETNEELSISPNIEYQRKKGTEIKRMGKQKKNSQPKPWNPFIWL